MVARCGSGRVLQAEGVTQTVRLSRVAAVVLAVVQPAAMDAG